MGWVVLLGVLLLLGLLPLGVHLTYNEDGFRVKILVAFLKLSLPYGKKDRREADKRASQKKTVSTNASGQKKPAGQSKQGGSVKDFLPLVKLAMDFLGDFRRKLRVDRLDVKLLMAADDPCDLAVNYGRARAAVGNLMPQLERIFVIRKRDIDVSCDFTASESRVTARLDATITLGRLLGLAAVYGVRGMKEYLKFSKKRKGGAVK